MDSALENYPDSYWGISDEWGKFCQISLVSSAPDPGQFLEDKSDDGEISSRKNADSQKFLEDKSGAAEISSLDQRRHKGNGSGCIYYRTVTKKGKQYREAYYQYEFWDKGDRLSKSSKYIPKGKLAQVQQLNNEKAPVREILKLLGLVMP